jgi:APA family basic amino acid/polyamine antiporter
MQFVTRLFGTSSVDRLREQSKNKVLRRALTAKDLVSIGLGTMIGGGIFTTIGTGVKGAGPAVIISYLIAGLTSFFAALCYAELGAMVPVAGSAYTYAYATLGKLFAWIIGFALIFEYGISAAPVAQQFSAAIQDVFKSIGVTLPQWAQTSNLIIAGPWWLPGSYDVAHSQYDVVGALFVLALSLLLSVGIRESATTNNIFVVLKISALIVFVIAGLFLFHAANLHDFNPHGWGKLVPFGGAAESSQPYSIIPIAAFVFFSYIGFDTATTTAEECKNPQRDIPMGVIGALAIGTIIYCATAIVLVGDMNWTLVPVKNPLVAALAPLHLPILNWAITMFTGVAVALMALIIPLTELLNLVNIGTLIAFTVVCAGVLYLRRRKPDLPRTFRVPFVPLFPVLGIVFSLFLAVFGLSRETWVWFSLALVVGLVFFFSYGFWKSNPDEVAMVVDPPGLAEYP